MSETSSETLSLVCKSYQSLHEFEVENTKKCTFVVVSCVRATDSNCFECIKYIYRYMQINVTE